ncbi:MAG: ROK family protein [candidate division Zixibacteria bacterium]|nr:ROK family protein [candidate division Zixibacteria bacterium]
MTFAKRWKPLNWVSKHTTGDNLADLAIGIDIGGTNIKSGIVSRERGDVVKSISRETASDPESISATIRSCVEELIESGAVPQTDLKHIGIASPGAVNTKSGVIFGSSPNIPGWEGTNLKDIVSEFGLPAYADNDANAAALGEAMFGAGPGCKDILYVTIGTGVGGGIIIDGEVHHGVNYGAAEIGHMIIEPGGRQCGCGNRGCMERYASITGMMITAREMLGGRKSGKLYDSIGGNIDKLQPEMITREFKGGDPIAFEIIKAQAEALAQAVSGALNLLNPAMLIIGGAISESGPEYINFLSKSITDKTFPAVSEILKIVPAKLGGNAGTVGAACLGWVS